MTDAFRNYANKRLQRKHDNWKQLDNFVLSTSYSGFVMLQNSFLFDIIDETVNSLIETGIMKLIFDFDIGTTEKIQYKNVHFRVIDLKDLLACFILFTGLCIISIFCFICEIKLHKHLRK